MNVDLIGPIVAALVSGTFSAMVTIVTLRVEMRWLRRDVDRLEKRVDNHLAVSRQTQPDTL